MTASPRKQNEWEEQSCDSQSGTDQAATSLSPRQHSVPNHTFPVFKQQKPTKKKNPKHMQTMEKASEGEENSRAKSYPAENKALKNC